MIQTKNENFSSVNEIKKNTNKYYKSSKIVNICTRFAMPRDKNSLRNMPFGDKHNKISKFIK